jgi:hypothetical protein
MAWQAHTGALPGKLVRNPSTEAKRQAGTAFVADRTGDRPHHTMKRG